MKELLIMIDYDGSDIQDDTTFCYYYTNGTFAEEERNDGVVICSNLGIWKMSGGKIYWKLNKTINSEWHKDEDSIKIIEAINELANQELLGEEYE